MSGRVPWRGWARRGRPRSRLALTDLLAEAAAGATRRPGRAAAATLGILLGTATAVAALALGGAAAGTGGGQAALVVVRDSRPGDEEPPFPEDAEQRLARLAGVRASGVVWRVPAGRELAVRLAPPGTGEPGGVQLDVVAASPGALAAAGAAVRHGRLFDGFHARRGELVAVLGADAAARLGVTDLERWPALFVGSRALTVLGIIDGAERGSGLLGAVTVPDRTAERLWGDRGTRRQEVLIRAEPGAARLLSEQAPLALRPHDPERLTATVLSAPAAPPRQGTPAASARLLLLAGALLAAGAVGVASAALASVLERAGEIGLRRALGATRGHVAAQLLAESALLGGAGGLVGACAGVVAATVAAAWWRQAAVIDPAPALLALLAGVLAGLLAGLYPASKAAAVDPARALDR